MRLSRLSYDFGARRRARAAWCCARPSTSSRAIRSASSASIRRRARICSPKRCGAPITTAISTSATRASSLSTPRISSTRAMPPSFARGSTPTARRHRPACRRRASEREGQNTTHFSIVDKDGNAVSLTYTLNDWFGAHVTAAGTGILLNDEMDDFSAKPGAPNMYGLVEGPNNAVAPGKRPLSSMTPTIVTKDGKLAMVVGTPGGSRIPSAVIETISNMIDFGMTVTEAVDAPRIHHQWLPDEIGYERFGLSADTVAKLEAMGHKVVPMRLWQPGRRDPGRRAGDRRQAARATSSSTGRSIRASTLGTSKDIDRMAELDPPPCDARRSRRAARGHAALDRDASDGFPDARAGPRQPQRDGPRHAAVSDGTYFMVESDGRIAGCGGWSWRSTLVRRRREHGVARAARRSIRRLTPRGSGRCTPIRISPGRASAGSCMQLCEGAAMEAGFRKRNDDGDHGRRAALRGVRLCPGRAGTERAGRRSPRAAREDGKAPLLKRKPPPGSPSGGLCLSWVNSLLKQVRALLLWSPRAEVRLWGRSVQQDQLPRHAHACRKRRRA